MKLTCTQIRQAIVDLLRQREPLATISPSEVARALAPGGWREHMPEIRDVAIAMAEEGVLEIRQRGRTLAPDGQSRGPIRLGLPASASTRHPTTPDGRY